ncbi:TIGR03086 family metal-binding protein [Streptomyces sp. NPDC052396]|uniref:TIGR03086 family metal-binding protein n=1 Tax=Streptomyces sp. NPDC052396 TaxID=3365689 RepID=UPI0037D1FA95
MTPDLRPATSVLAELVRGVRDNQLDAPTPCGGLTVAELLDHIDSLCMAFTAAGTREFRTDGGRAPVPDASRLGTDWRDRLPARLDELAQAWRPSIAWVGTTQIGGGELPAQAAGASAVDEVVVHGWELAVATGQPFPGGDPSLTEALETAYDWVRSVVEQNPDGSPGLFGPPLPVPDHAPLLDQLLGLTGRYPGWRPT